MSDQSYDAGSERSTLTAVDGDVSEERALLLLAHHRASAEASLALMGQARHILHDRAATCLREHGRRAKRAFEAREQAQTVISARAAGVLLLASALVPLQAAIRAFLLVRQWPRTRKVLIAALGRVGTRMLKLETRCYMLERSNKLLVAAANAAEWKIVPNDMTTKFDLDKEYRAILPSARKEGQWRGYQAVGWDTAIVNEKWHSAEELALGMGMRGPRNGGHTTRLNYNKPWKFEMKVNEDYDAITCSGTFILMARPRSGTSSGSTVAYDAPPATASSAAGRLWKIEREW